MFKYCNVRNRKKEHIIFLVPNCHFQSTNPSLNNPFTFEVSVIHTKCVVHGPVVVRNWYCLEAGTKIQKQQSNILQEFHRANFMALNSFKEHLLQFCMSIYFIIPSCDKSFLLYVKKWWSITHWKNIFLKNSFHHRQFEKQWFGWLASYL